jgi:hypothetical protein
VEAIDPEATSGERQYSSLRSMAERALSSMSSWVWAKRKEADEMSPLNLDPNRPTPPLSHVVGSNKAPRIKPRMVKWAVAALWVSFGLSFTHAAIVIGDRLISWPPQRVVLIQVASNLFYAAIILFVSRGRNWARIIYAILLCLRTINVVTYFPDDWRGSHGLLLVTVVSFSCQYIAMYWLWSEPGRGWFVRSLAD